MASPDPKSKPPMADGEEEYEYEEIEVEEEVEDDNDEQEEEVEYEEVEEEVEYEEVEEQVEEEEEDEEIEYEEVEEEVEGEEIEYEEVEEEEEEEEEAEYEEVEEEVGDGDGDGAGMAEEGEEKEEDSGDGEIDANSHMDCMEHVTCSTPHPVSVKCDTNVSLDTHPTDITKTGNGDEMLSTSECPIIVKSEANNPSDIQTSLADVPVKQCCAPDSSNAQVDENKATGMEVNAAADVEPVDDGNHKPSRSSLQARQRSPSPGAGCEDRNKRPAVICEYFAKGWCIKGSSCRFLHKRDHVNGHTHKVEGDMLPSNSNHQLGSGDVAGRSKLPVHFQSDVGINDDALPSSSVMNDTQLEHVERDNKTALYEKNVTSRVSASSQASPYNNKSNSIFDSKEVEGEIFRENYSFHHCNYREATISGSGDGFGSMQKRYSLDGFGSSGSVPYSSFMSSHMNNSKGPLISSKYKSTFVPYNWEPSVPFRPSFFIPSMIRTSSDVQYDPLRDSIEQPDVRHLSSRIPLEFPDRRGSIFEDVQSISGRNALETDKNLHHDVWDENYCSQKKEVAPTNSAEASTNDVPNILEEENLMIPPNVKDMLKADKNAADGSSNLRSDGMGDDKIIITEKERKSSHLDEDESKALKHFRGALIEFVKELMKPVWHEGRLSKDVYKVIVQKAEDKILSTLASDKVPNTSESVKQYLSASRPKILKLIQAYVDKYGKF